jgi:hypothetical protein
MWRRWPLAAHQRTLEAQSQLADRILSEVFSDGKITCCREELLAHVAVLTYESADKKRLLLLRRLHPDPGA